jgi:hypothetical protein
MPRFFIRKSKYDDSPVTMCLSIIGCKHVLHDVSLAGRPGFTCERALLGLGRGLLMAVDNRLDRASYGRDPRSRVRMSLRRLQGR